MEIKKLVSGVLSVNTYFVINKENNTAVVIDGGESYNFIKNAEKELGVKVIAELLTHSHFDHSGNAKALQDNGVKIYIHENEAINLKTGDTLSLDFGKPFQTLTPDYTFSDNEIIKFGGFEFKVMHTAGHSEGSVCFVLDNNIFSGDTLFNLSIGRTDFAYGDYAKMKASLKKLVALKEDYNIYPGHGESTTLLYEKQNNYYLKNL